MVTGFKGGEEKKKWRVIQEISIEGYAPHAVERMKGSLDFVFTAEICFQEKEDSFSENDMFSLEQSVLSSQD
jgi:hypothetical protein